MQRALLLLLIAGSYLLLAGGPVWTRWPLVALAAVAAAAAPRHTFAFPSHARGLDTALLTLMLAIAIQAVPLPAGLVAALSPQTPAMVAATHFTVGAPAAWLPLSIEPAATAEALVIVALGVLTLWIARGAFAAGASTREFSRALGWLAGLLAVVTIVQKATAPRLLMGLVIPEARNASPFGPFLNRNHFAAWMLLASAAAIGYIVAHLHIHPAYRSSFRQAFRHFLTSGAMLSGICATLSIGALVLTLSRSALAGLGAAALCAAWLGRSRLRVERNNLPAVFGLAGSLLLIGMIFIDLDGWATRLQQSLGVVGDGFSRLTIWRESLPLLRDFWLTGTGAGTYGLAMSQYQETRVWIGEMQGWAHFNNAHSHYVQVASEGGLLIGLPAIAALLMLARHGLRAIRADKGEVFWIRVGAAAGLAGLAVQSIWEVALTMPANAVLAGALAGLLTFRREHPQPSPYRQDPDSQG